MHSKRVLHRDIKSDNILIRKDGTIKICDLGLSSFKADLDEWRKTRTGTPHWCAPEILNGRTYNRKVDIYSFGCFAYELATGTPPFFHSVGGNHIHTALNETPEPISARRWSANFANFVDLCLKKDPKQRPDIDELLQHPFLNGVAANVEAYQEAWCNDYNAWLTNT